jgi:hypothetical protein
MSAVSTSKNTSFYGLQLIITQEYLIIIDDLSDALSAVFLATSKNSA